MYMSEVTTMPKRCKNPLMMVTATIAYYMELEGIDTATIIEGLIPKGANKDVD